MFLGLKMCVVLAKDEFGNITSANDPTTRKKYVKLVESVRRKGAEVLIFSSMHESGQREFVVDINENLVSLY